MLGPRNQEVTQCLKSTPLSGSISTSVKHVGFVLYSNLKMDKQINCHRFKFICLRLLAKTKPFLSTADFEKVIKVVVFLQIDYCNSLYFGIENRGTSESVIPILKSLKWLPVRYRIS